jgi:hypothetical protein
MTVPFLETPRLRLRPLELADADQTRILFPHWTSDREHRVALYLRETGMRVIATGERDYACGRLPAEVWESTAEEWNARRSDHA